MFQLNRPDIEENLTDATSYVNESKVADFFKYLKQDLSNRTCFDCSSKNPTWISVSFGIFLCLECSGNHRSMGANTSFIRSTEFDQLNLRECITMEVGGNQTAAEAIKQPNKQVNYASPSCDKYKKKLAGLVDEKLKQSRIRCNSVYKKNGLANHNSKIDCQENAVISSSDNNKTGMKSAEVTYFSNNQTDKPYDNEDIDNNFDFDSAFEAATVSKKSIADYLNKNTELSSDIGFCKGPNDTSDEIFGSSIAEDTYNVGTDFVTNCPNTNTHVKENIITELQMLSYNLNGILQKGKKVAGKASQWLFKK